MYRKNEVWRGLNRMLAIIAVAIILALTILGMSATKFGSLHLANAQDLNPPTTGRTTPNVTSSFGTNMTAANHNLTAR
jgi:hypothetical protein